MRKTIITLSALCISVFCSAQLKTTSAYDVDGNGAVTGARTGACRQGQSKMSYATTVQR